MQERLTELPDKDALSAVGGLGARFFLSNLIILNDAEALAFTPNTILVLLTFLKVYAANPDEFIINLPSTTAYPPEQGEFPAPVLTNAQ